MKIDAEKNFGKRVCPACACAVNANNNECPICHYPFPNPTSPQKNLKLWGGIIMLPLILLWALNLL